MLDSCWLIRTEKTAADVRDELMELVDSSDEVARRQAAIYVAGPADGPPLPGRALTRAVLEQSFTQSSRNRPR